MEYSKKNDLEQKLKNHIVNALNNKIFSGVSIAVGSLHSDRVNRRFINAGKIEFESDAQDIENSVFFDLASLTKPLVTVLSLFQLVQQKKLLLTDTLETIFPERCLVYHRDVKIVQLLRHSSGMSAHKEFFRRPEILGAENRKKSVIDAIFNEEPEYIPDSKHVYSDLGYMVLGEVIEKISGKSLNDYWYENICRPLGLERFYSFPPDQKSHGVYAVTGECPRTMEKLAGRVHDDNCRCMGGIAGHAGLFGTIEGVYRLCEIILNSLLGKTEFFAGLNEWGKRIGNSNWSNGFDMVSKLGASSGKYFTSTSIGHLGFTGVSFWIDIEQQIIVVLLTNRVLNTADNREIKKFRPFIHNQIMEFLLLEEKS